MCFVCWQVKDEVAIKVVLPKCIDHFRDEIAAHSQLDQVAAPLA